MVFVIIVRMDILLAIRIICVISGLCHIVLLCMEIFVTSVILDMFLIRISIALRRLLKNDLDCRNNYIANDFADFMLIKFIFMFIKVYSISILRFIEVLLKF